MAKDFDNITAVNPKIIRKCTNNYPSDYLMEENETNFKILRLKILNLKFVTKDFDNITAVNPKIIRKYTNNHPSDYLVDKNETDFENLNVIDSKLEICGKGF